MLMIKVNICLCGCINHSYQEINIKMLLMIQRTPKKKVCLYNLLLEVPHQKNALLFSWCHQISLHFIYFCKQRWYGKATFQWIKIPTLQRLSWFYSEICHSTEVKWVRNAVTQNTKTYQHHLPHLLPFFLQSCVESMLSPWTSLEYLKYFINKT